MYDSPMISVVVPTCNRPNELRDLLNCLSKQIIKVSEIIIVDSSDFEIDLGNQKLAFPRLEHIKVEIKSAAIQRNIGMGYVNVDCTYLSFLDDDVKPNADYLSNLVKGLEMTHGIGISGLAVNPIKGNVHRIPPKGIFGLVQRLFQLDSLIDGKLLKSGVNIPVRDHTGAVRQVEWLIGCSVWDYKKIANVRFEPDFKGASLSEDVIFSVRASVYGNLFVDPSTHLWHTESEIGRQRGANFWKMWVVNRKRLVQVMSKNKPNYFHFHLANFGQALSLTYNGFRNKTLFDGSLFGIVQGYKQLYISGQKNEN